jgi:hypothetical protein
VGFGEVPQITVSRGTTRIRFPDSKPLAKQNDRDLHADSTAFGAIYANDLAMRVYPTTQSQAYPVGSILVREKLSQPNAAKPELLAVMIKREKGFNPTAGDWSFLLVNGSGSKVKKRTKAGGCLSCHQHAWANDYVFELK